MSESILIDVKNFRMRFGEKEVIKNLSFTVKKGEVFGLLGCNGSGKTTTIRALLGLHQATAGQLLIAGQTFRPDGKLKIGYLPEERGLYKKEKVGNIMRYFAELKGLNPHKIDETIYAFLDKVGLLEHINTRLDKLSSGQQQKIQLGITILGSPDLLILDEPTKGFDPLNRKLLLDIIESERQRGATILMITHHMEEVEKLCDRILLLKDGEAKAYGRIEDIKDQAGNKRIKLSFNGQLPTDKAPFRVVSINKNQAELELKDQHQIDEVLSYLIKQKLEIRQYSVDRPSLDEIFVKIYGAKLDEEEGHA